MTTRRLTLHVGAHKTATSLVQGFLAQPSHPGRSVGIFHLGRGETRHLIGWGSALLRRPEALALRLAQEAARREAEVVFVSHEDLLGRPFGGVGHLYPRARNALRALAQVAAGYDVQVILSIRPQDQFLESYYLQRVQEGIADPFRVWLGQLDLERISWRPLVELLREVFGVPPVLVDFRRIREGQEVFLREFLDVILPGHDLDAVYQGRHNPSLSGKGLHIALAANRVLGSRDERKLMREFLQTHFSNVGHPRAVLLRPEQRQALRERYEAEYEALLAELGPEAHAARTGSSEAL